MSELQEIITLAHHLKAGAIRSLLNRSALGDIRDATTPPPTAMDDSGRSAQRFELVVQLVRDGVTRTASSGAHACEDCLAGVRRGCLKATGTLGAHVSEEGQEPLPSGPPVPTGPPNVPEFQPAFPGQTRVPAIQTKTDLQVTEIASGFRNPWAIAFLPDQRMLVTEKPTGSLYIVTSQGVKSPAVAGLPPVDGRGQGGLLDVEVGPDYAQSSLIYWTYYEPREGGNGLAVARAKLVEGAQPRVEGVQVIFRMMPTLESTLHAGGRLVFTPDGKLFVTLGERSILAGRVQARDVRSHFGKVVRINPDGSVPQDNPFVNTEGARPESWSVGHRNILSAALDRQQRLWTVEMGPRGGDELNRPEAGKDYGWPTIGYGEEYSGAPMRNDRVVGEERLLTDLRARIREVVQGPEGALYLLTDATNGKLLKLTPR